MSTDDPDPLPRGNDTIPVDLSRFAWLSIFAAIVTIALKSGAWALTGSVGLLSDAAESLVNLAAAVVALISLKIAATPADSKYPYGRSKAEYFSAAAEGIMILFAAGAIMITAVQRFVHPQPIENVGLGLLISVVASLINGGVGLVLWRAGRKYRSLTLTADAKHLWTDVITSIGVIVGVFLVWLTDINRLDAVVAFAVGVNIIVTGIRILIESLQGLLDVTLPEEDNQKIVAVLARYSSQETAFHGLQTRISGRERFMNVHVLVPGSWTVQEGHTFCEQVEREIERELTDIRVITHLEPIEDPASYADIPRGHLPIVPSPDAPGGAETPGG